MIENLEKTISNPREELFFFEDSLNKKSFSNFGNSFEKLDQNKQTEVVEQAVLEHKKIAPQKITKEFAQTQENKEKIILNLIPEEDDEKMESFLGFLEDKGLLNTLNLIETTESSHIKDDFHRFLVQYLKSGYNINFKENSLIYPGLHMTLFEVYLPEFSNEKEKEKNLELLLSSMEQFYAGMFSVSGDKDQNNYFSIEIAYPQGREEVVFFSAIPDKKKNIFKNQILAIFPNAVIKENTNDYNIFNKTENTLCSEAFLEKELVFPIKTYKELTYDPLNIILESFSNLKKTEGAAIQIILSPGKKNINRKLIKVLDKVQKGDDIDMAISLKQGFSVKKVINFIESVISWINPKETKKEKKEIKDTERRLLIVEEIKKKNSSRFYKTNIRLISSGNSVAHAQSILSELEASFNQFENILGNNIKFKSFFGKKLRQKIKAYTFRIFDKKNFIYFNITELTTIFHFPEISLKAGNILATASFASAGVSKKISENDNKQDFKVELSSTKIKDNKTKLQFKDKQDNETKPRDAYREDEVSDDKIMKWGDIDDFILDNPDDSWVKNKKELSDYIKDNNFNKDFKNFQNLNYQDENLNLLKKEKKDNFQNIEKVNEMRKVENNVEDIEKINQENFADVSLKKSKNILLGYNTHQGIETNIYMKAIDRMRHMYVIGKSGVGKTNILKNMIIQDIENGEGCCFIDPHGSDIEDILSQIPEHRFKDVIYFDPTNIKQPMGMNMLEYDSNYPEQKTFVVNELFGIFKKLYADSPESMGPAFEQYFRNATLLVLEHPESGCTMVEISRVLSDENYRNLKLKHCKNMIVKQFWEKIATQAEGDSELVNIVPYITNKFDIFLANDFLRPIIAQEKSAFNFRNVMDNRKILLVNLSKGKLGDINSNLIGLILVGKILMSALSRVDSLDKNLPPFYLYIDEFQNVTTDSISQILSEARKYKLSLNIAHQYIKQIDEKIRDAVFGNVGSMAVFRVGPEDAEFLEKQFSPVFTSTDILNLNNYNAYLKILVDGEPQKPFNITTYPPKKGNIKAKEYLKKISTEKYGRNREEIESEIQEKFKSLL